MKSSKESFIFCEMIMANQKLNILFIFHIFELEKRQRLFLFYLSDISQLYLQQRLCQSLQQVFYAHLRSWQASMMN